MANGRIANSPALVIIVLCFLSVGVYSFPAADQQIGRSIFNEIAAVLNPHLRFLQPEDVGSLVANYCGVEVSDQISQFKPEFTRKIFRGDPVSDLLLNGLAVIGGDAWRERLLSYPNYFSSDGFAWQNDIGSGLGIFWLCFVALAIVLLVIAVVMMPGCCSSVWRNCLGWIFCKKCCHDRERVRPISEIKKWKRNCLWIGGLIGIILLLLFTLLSLAFSIKFFWTPSGALCQIGRILQELDFGILYNQEASESSWMGTLPDDVQWLGLHGLEERMSAELGSIAAGSLRDKAASLWSSFDQVWGDFGNQLANNWLSSSTFYSAIGLVAISALILVGATFVIVMLVLLNRHYKNNTEPRHKVYANWFTFFWGWFAITGALLLLLGISIMTGLSVVSATCQWIRHGAEDVTIFGDYELTRPLYENSAVALEACFARSGDGWWFNDMAAGLGDFIFQSLKSNPDYGVNCKPLGFSIASGIDGICGGVQQDLFWISLGWCLAAAVSLWFWIICYKLFHYFKERANRGDAEPDDETPPHRRSSAARQLESSPSAVVALAKRRGHEELVRQLKEVDPQTFGQDSHSNTALHAAAYAGDVALCESLVNRNAPIDEFNNFGFTPVAVAASEGHSEAVSFLVRRGADPTVLDQFGESPLHAAARAGDLAVVEALCQDCAPAPVYRNDEGEVAADTAAFAGHRQVEAFLNTKTPREQRATAVFGLPSTPETAEV